MGAFVCGRLVLFFLLGGASLRTSVGLPSNRSAIAIADPTPPLADNGPTTWSHHQCDLMPCSTPKEDALITKSHGLLSSKFAGLDRLASSRMMVHCVALIVVSDLEMHAQDPYIVVSCRRPSSY